MSMKQIQWAEGWMDDANWPGQGHAWAFIGGGVSAPPESEPNALRLEEMRFYILKQLAVQSRGNSQIWRKSVLHILQSHKP